MPEAKHIPDILKGNKINNKYMLGTAGKAGYKKRTLNDILIKKININPNVEIDEKVY
jgi:hypothetical protein